MLISPAEPAALKHLGRSSSTPEHYGADFLISSPVYGLVGIQRKELSDLVASIKSDDRLSREVIAMKELDYAIWIIEGTPQWTSDGQATWTRTKYTHTQHRGLLFSLMFQGFLVAHTNTLSDTGELLSHLNHWLIKEHHSGLNFRPGARGEWGKADKTEWQIHFLQGLPGLGYERARLIVETFSGLPLCLTQDLRTVNGLGDKTVTKIEEVFRHD